MLSFNDVGSERGLEWFLMKLVDTLAANCNDETPACSIASKAKRNRY